MQAQDDKLPVRRGLLAALLTAAFFVAPLLFFTGLTRNPYYLQIVILNLALLGASALFILASLRRGTWLLPRAAASRPLAALGLIYLASFLLSWFGHAPFFRPAMASEGLKAGLFFLINVAAVFYLSYSVPFAGEGEEEPRAGRWLALVLGWGALWLLFPFLRTPPAGNGLLDRLLDPYGLLVWAAGFAAVWALVRRCRQEDVLHLALAAGVIASLYGILEYFHVEVVWAKLINPYGNRSVSTFGNPNFISTYVVILLPLAVSLLLKARGAAQRWFYGLAVLSYEGMLMCSLTRSSWIGAAAALALLFSFRSHREALKAGRRFLYPFFGAALLLLLFWPASSLKPLSSGLLDRVSEAVTNVNSPSDINLAGDTGRVYASLHQRLLIWTSAWQMGLQDPLLGNGWGQFELFYPFFQGRLMLAYPMARGLRTHANNAHNEVLEQWSQAGILGLGAFLWLLVVLFGGFLRFYRSAGPEAAYPAVPLAAGLAGALADNMLNVSLHFAVPALAFWWVAGALARRTAGAVQRGPWARPRLSAVLAWALLGACLAGAWFWQRQFKREFLYFEGFRAMRAGDARGAAESLFGAWQAHPREVNSNYEMGNAYVRSGDEQKGLWAYGEALKSNAGYDEIYFNRAIVLKRLGRLAEARADLRASTLINPMNLTAWQALAEAYLTDPGKAALAPEAVADFSEAVRVFPHDGNLWNTLGYFYTLAKDYKAARDAYGRGVLEDPENRMLAENLAGVSRQLGTVNDPDLAWLAAYSRLAASLSGTPGPGDLKAADGLVAAHPGNVKALALRAKLLFKAGRLDEAAADLRAVLAEDYADNSARYGLAVILEKKGDLKGAAAQWRAFLELEPGNSAVAARLKADSQGPAR